MPILAMLLMHRAVLVQRGCIPAGEGDGRAVGGSAGARAWVAHVRALQGDRPKPECNLISADDNLERYPRTEQ